MILWSVPALAGTWVDLARPSRVGGGEADAALVIGIEDYWAVPDVPGAATNARDWHAWFVDGRGTPADRVQLLLDAEATAEQIATQVARLSAEVSEGGRLWVVFIGHGAPSRDGRDGLLLGADVQQTAQSVYSRGLTRDDLLHEAGEVPAVLVLDTCFSGRTADGAALVPGLQPMIPSYERPTTAIELTAAGSDQFAGSLPGLPRPAFSYLVLGALQGWGDEDSSGDVTASEAVTWTRRTLAAAVVDRVQQPEHAGPDAVLSQAGKVQPLDLAGLVRAREPSRAIVLSVPELGEAPAVRGQVDPALEEAWLAAVEVDGSLGATPEATAEAWCRLARYNGGEHHYAGHATEACEAWTTFAEAQADANARLAEDYGRLREVVALGHVPTSDRLASVEGFLGTFGQLDDWHVDRVRRAADRLERGRSARLPKYQEPPGWALKPRPRGRVIYFPWHMEYWRTGVFGVRAGAAVSERGDFGVAGALYGMTVGAVDLSFLTVTGVGGPAAFKSSEVQLGLAPFGVRTSRRVPGELRGSVLNPAAGFGWHFAQVSADDRDGGVGALYVANNVWPVNWLGIRLEYRHPLPVVTGELVQGDVAGTFVVELLPNGLGAL